jgi:tripeptide aminopeptidase
VNQEEYVIKLTVDSFVSESSSYLKEISLENTVIDHRGTGDIVTSCGGYEDFCNESFGLFIEELAESKGLGDWKCTKGGSSDTRIWARHGIQGVNLSVGYQQEHTCKETLDTEATYNTLKLLMGVFENARELRQVVRRIQRRAIV